MALTNKYTYKSMEQNRKSRNRPTQICPNNFDKYPKTLQRREKKSNLPANVVVAVGQSQKKKKKKLTFR